MTTSITIPYIKSLGKDRNDANLNLLINLYNDSTLSLELKREVISSIGRQNNKAKVADFIEKNFKNPLNSMDMVYQFYRTCLYNIESYNFEKIALDIENYYKNEIIYKMKDFYIFKKSKNKFIQTISELSEPTLLVGDCSITLKKIKEKSVKLIFTSPPYYNAREYSVYKSYQEYLDKMKDVLTECHHVLEDGRFIVINVSPVITKRPGREFESIRYPIHFDFHKILSETGFEFVDEIIWLKPEYSVPNRNGGYAQTQKPLSYKPNCVTESVMVYRKKAAFLLDENIKAYKDFSPMFTESFDRTNCWLISPRASKDHPAIFPKELCEKIIHYYSFPGDLILDPFGGSGTFGDVAREMYRIPLLCEMHPKYIKHILKKGYNLI